MAAGGCAALWVAGWMTAQLSSPLLAHYEGQEGEAMCSVASFAMVLNAVRAGLPGQKHAPRITQSGLIERVRAQHWRDRVTGHFPTVTLQEMAWILERAFQHYGLPLKSIRVVRVDAADDIHLQRLTQDLALLSDPRRYFIVADFLQSALMGQAHVGHVAPLGGYDPINERVFVLDPDRKDFEPYWASTIQLLKGMATLDTDAGRNRGYLVVEVPKPPAPLPIRRPRPIGSYSLPAIR